MRLRTVILGVIFLVGCQSPPAESKAVSSKVTTDKGGTLLWWQFQSSQGGRAGLNEWFYRQAKRLEACPPKGLKNPIALSFQADFKQQKGRLKVTDAQLLGGNSFLTTCYQKVLSEMDGMPKKSAQQGRLYLWVGALPEKSAVTPFRLSYRLWGQTPGKGLPKGVFQKTKSP